MKVDLGGQPHAVPEWLQRAEFVGSVPRSRLEGKPLTRREKEQGYQGLLLPDFMWGAADRSTARALHKLGVRSVVYISFSIRVVPPPPPRKKKGRRLPSESEREQIGRGSFLARRPELAIYDKRGVRQRCIFADQNSPYRIEICPNTRGVVEEPEKEVRRIMATGVDAVFIDHVFGVSKCHGEELGIHEHLYHEDDIHDLPEEHLRFAPGTDAPNDDPLSNFAYAMLLRRMHDVVAEYGDDKVLIGNTTFWPFKYSAKLKKYVLFSPAVHRRVPELFWRYMDCGMVESYMFVPKRFVSAESNASTNVTWRTYPEWEREAEIPAHYRELGRRLIALPYFGTRARKEDAFFGYAAARLDNLIWMGGHGRSTRQFCTFRLGVPTSQKQRRGPLRWRSFQHGVIALNPTDKPVEALLRAAWPTVTDLYSGRSGRVEGGRLAIKLPAKAGRVYLAADS